MAQLPLNGQVREHELLRRVVVPFVTRCSLVVPHVRSGISVESDDRINEQVVALVQASLTLIPLDSIAGTEVKQVELRVERDGIPYRRAAAELPPLSRPGFCGSRHGFVFERLGGGARAPGRTRRP